ncbi:hypothetical protein FPRO05_12343 [Fusarium proliferatum]|uniref:Uncharacterized protein n=1 Tax=Gibberella intermedia TaxID=948311 RepID=A0A365N4Q5_GIBIN|nr:hypothetical protein FPRO05_12343 [Fusarium proliferatum]
MEPLGAFASIVTIVALIRPTAKLVKSLKGITSDDGYVSKEVFRMVKRIQGSATSIDIGLEALKCHSSTLEKMQQTQSKVLQSIIDNKSLDIIVSGTESIRKQMSDTTRDLKDMRERPRIIKKIDWLLRNKMEVESLFPEMQLVVACLSLVCPIIRIEIDKYILKKSSGEVAQCLKQEMQLEIVEGQLSTDDEPYFEAATKPLLRLAQSVRRRSSARRPQGAPSGRRSPVPEEIFLSPAPSRTAQPSPRARRPKPQSVPVPCEVPPEATRHTSSSLESSRPRSAVPSSSTQTPDSPATPQSPDAPKSPRIDTSARTVGSREGIVRAIQGHIINHGKAIPVKSAMIDNLGSFNYISVKTATQLGLDIQELDPGEHSQTHDGAHERILPGKVIGKVTGVGWRKAGWRKPIPAEFLVKDSYRGRMYEHVAFGMIFASDFDAAGGGS